MNQNNLVEILLPVFNGGKYLCDQLDSLFRQSYSNIRVLIRDDISSDNSKEIINNYRQRYADKILVIDSQKNLGSSLSFHELLKHSSADYVMFCDQDDIWLPKKVENSLKAITDDIHFTKKIRCVYSDLSIVDEELNNIHYSMRQALKLGAHPKDYKDYLCQSQVTGCTMILNRDAVNCLLSYPPPERNIVHDHWYTVVLSIYGQLRFLDERNILYRQHLSNQVGVKPVTISYFARKMKTFLSTYRYDMTINNYLPKEYRIGVLRWCLCKFKLNIWRLH